MGKRFGHYVREENGEDEVIFKQKMKDLHYIRNVKGSYSERRNIIPDKFLSPQKNSKNLKNVSKHLVSAKTLVRGKIIQLNAYISRERGLKSMA